jgi:ubiquitin C-terminal hydrolase
LSEKFESMENQQQQQQQQQQNKNDAKWFHISDSNVRHVSVEEVLKAQAYILFYRRQMN